MCGWRDCVLAGLRVGGIAVRGLSGLRRVLQVVGLRACRRDCRSCRIVWLAGLCGWRDCRRVLHVAGLQDCRQWVVRIAYGWDCLRVGLPHAGLRVGLRV